MTEPVKKKTTSISRTRHQTGQHKSISQLAKINNVELIITLN